ncbi:MAG TPA: acetate--CoA ligase family protein [Burkholderiaceae bacterium]|nr:acetate--CoA ligase family protein [Burkholderiaceae bacterium]
MNAPREKPTEGVRTAMDRLFRPRSVALIGVSADMHKLNGRPFWLLRQHRFPGPIHLVNPKYDEIDGVRCLRRVDDIPGPVDAALVMVPAAQVPEAIRACGRVGIANAIVLSSGFEEAQGSEALVEDLTAAAREGNVQLVGPNCEGIWSVAARTVLTFGSAARRETLHHAPIGVISQSGSIGGAVVRLLQDAGHGCSYFVSVGNETLVDAIDFLEWMVEQEDVRVVLVFLEGLTEGHRLSAVAARGRARGVRLVALKSGTSAAGRAATASHTGKIAAPFAVYRTVLKQCGVIQVDSISELIEAAEILSTQPDPTRVTGPAPGVAVFSIPGGTRALTADACERLGVPLAQFDDATVGQLQRRLPTFGYARNPTDITGQVLSNPELFSSCLGIIAGDPNVEAVIVQFANGGPHDAVRWRPMIKQVAADTGKPLVMSFMADQMPATARQGFAKDGLMIAREPVEAVKYLGWLYQSRASRAMRRAPDSAPVARAALPRADDIEGWERQLATAGIRMPSWRRVRADDDPALACAGLRFPMVAKAMPSAADHKTEAGLIHLGLRNGEALVAAVADLRHKLPAGSTVLVQEMVRGGVEAVLAMTRDPDFGPLLAIGSGGVLVELLHDMTFLSPPVDAGQVHEATGRLSLGRLLDGFRGAPRADHHALCRAALGLVELYRSADPAVTAIELNPVFVMPEGEGVVAVDLLVQ